MGHMDHLADHLAVYSELNYWIIKVIFIQKYIQFIHTAALFGA